MSNNKPRNMRGMSSETFYGFVAGQAQLRRIEHMQKARNEKFIPLRKALVKWARGWHHDYLRYLRAAADASMSKDAGEA